MYCTHTDCPDYRPAQGSGGFCARGEDYLCPTRDDLKCCKDCSYQCKQSLASEGPTGCPLADEELGYK